MNRNVNYWQPMENAFPVEKRSELMDKFFRDYLTMKLASIPNKEQVYDDFKSYCINTGVSNNTKELAEDLFFYVIMRFPQRLVLTQSCMLFS